MDVSGLDKTALRRSLLQQRRSMAVAQWQQQSRDICHYLQASPLVQQATTILAYFSFRQEPDLQPLFSLPKNWGFPRCVGSSLLWHRWSPQEPVWPLQKGAFGILEPHPESPAIDLQTVDLFLVPAVACDRQGYRLGYGGGFYDRLLSHPQCRGKPTIAITFSFAFVPQLPHDSWDIPLQGVCTEAGLQLFS